MYLPSRAHNCVVRGSCWLGGREEGRDVMVISHSQKVMGFFLIIAICMSRLHCFTVYNV